MVHRDKENVKRAPSRAKEPRAASAAAPQRLETHVKALEQERDLLKAELEAARQRIASLEESRSAVASRIDWVIESLHGVIDADG
jgi:chromosome segregation ATPase